MIKVGFVSGDDVEITHGVGSESPNDIVNRNWKADRLASEAKLYLV